MNVSSEQLTPAERAGLVEALLPLDHPDLCPPGDGVHAAVLVGLWRRNGRLHTLLTRRPDGMRSHAGQISFPGGRIDPGETFVDAAVREAFEEVGLPEQNIELLGGLPAMSTVVTGFEVTPVVALIEPLSEWVLSENEVDEILELPLADLKAGMQKRFVKARGIPLRVNAYVVDDAVVWGATGRILGDLFARIPH